MSRGIITLSSVAALAAFGVYYYSPALPPYLQDLGLPGYSNNAPPAEAGGGVGAGSPRPAALASSAPAFAVQEFDYVVVGGGTAGLVVAARLSEDERVRVGVLEAGGYVPPGADPRIDLVVNYGLVFGDPAYDWNLKSVPQEGLDGRVVQETV
jgi:GMC oxidoreductase